MDDRDLTPERLDEVMDGEPPSTRDEREYLQVAARLRAEAPEPSERLRRSVAELGEPRRRRRPTAARRPGLAPALATAILVLVGVTVAARSLDRGPGTDRPVIASTGQDAADANTQVAPDGQASAAARTSGREELATTTARGLQSIEPDAPLERWTIAGSRLQSAVDAVQRLARTENLSVTLVRAPSSAEMAIAVQSGGGDALADRLRSVLVDAGARPAAGPATGGMASATVLRILIEATEVP